MENQSLVWIVYVEDVPLHTNAEPECDDPTCPCHPVKQQNTLNSPLDESAEDEKDLAI